MFVCRMKMEEKHFLFSSCGCAFCSRAHTAAGRRLFSVLHAHTEVVSLNCFLHRWLTGKQFPPLWTLQLSVPLDVSAVKMLVHQSWAPRKKLAPICFTSVSKSIEVRWICYKMLLFYMLVWRPLKYLCWLFPKPCTSTSRQPILEQFFCLDIIQCVSAAPVH